MTLAALFGTQTGETTSGRNASSTIPLGEEIPKKSFACWDECHTKRFDYVENADVISRQ